MENEKIFSLFHVHAPAMIWLGHIMLPRHSVIINFPIIISTIVAHIQLKFDIWMYHRNVQVLFLNLVLVQWFLTELCFLKGCIYKADILYVDYLQENKDPSSNLVPVRCFWKLCLLNFWKSDKFLVSAL